MAEVAGLVTRQAWRLLGALAAGLPLRYGGPDATAPDRDPLWADAWQELAARGYVERRGRRLIVTPAGQEAWREVGQWRA